MKKALKRSVIVVLLCCTALASYYYTIKHDVPENYKLEPVAATLETSLASIYTDIDSLFNNETLLTDIAENGFSSAYADVIAEKPYFIYVFQDVKAIYWSSNKVIPSPFLSRALANGSGFIKLQNGYYESVKVNKTIQGKAYNIIAFIPIKKEFSLSNNYLRSNFNSLFKLPKFLEISLTEKEFTYPVKGKGGNVIFHIEVDPDLYSKHHPLGLETIFWQLFFVLLLVSIAAIVRVVELRFGVWFSLLLLTVSLILGRWLLLEIDYPLVLQNIPFFDPELYASSYLNRSLGDLFINISLILWWCYYIFKKVKITEDLSKQPKPVALITAFLTYVVILLGVFFINQRFKSLILDSNISFDFNDFFGLTIYSLIGVVCFALIFLSFILLCYRLLQLLKQFELPRQNKLYMLLAAIMLFLAVLVYTGIDQMNLFSIGWGFIAILFLHRLIRLDREITNLTTLITLLILISLFTSVHVFQFNQIKSVNIKEAFARKLSRNKDQIAEYLFKDIEERIAEDAFIKNYFLKPYISTQEIVQRINKMYFKGYFSKYNINVFALNKEGIPFEGDNTRFIKSLNTEIIEVAEITEAKYLFFIPKPGSKFTYIGSMPIYINQKFMGTLIIELNPKAYTNTNLYPELLLEENIKPSYEAFKYDYAVYENDTLVNKQGSYAYQYNYSFPPSEGKEHLHYTQNNYNHLIYFTGDNRKVVISTADFSIIQPVSLFSYLFCLFLVLSFVIVLFIIGFRTLEDRLIFKERFNLTFREKIQFSMILIIITSFVVIGLVTIFQLTGQYDSYHAERLRRKEAAITASIEYIINDNREFLEYRDFTNPKWKQPGVVIDITALSDIHSMDINLYDLNGELINTSQPDIFEKGLITKQINPVAYRNLKVHNKLQHIQIETIGDLNYLSIYVPVKSNTGEQLAYLNLPYFAREKELNTEISSFLVTLINVYVFLMVIGGFLAYFIADSITGSLKVISEKIKRIQLTSKNEPIHWKGDDEIGTLVKEYNKMIAELEEGANLLAKSERESAWREMAKQIAHEIKNPLTPMKLSIQHLQRAMADDNPKAKEMANRVAATLIEQIDNLSQIATEFSIFAKMPKGVYEKFDLMKVIESVVDLFGKHDHVEIILENNTNNFMIFADKNQIMRAFNNLIKNAIQAIPEDAKGIIRVKIEGKGNKALVIIKDNGVGIDKDQAKKVFVPNFTTKSSGTGLGLSITKQIIENAKGDVWFESVKSEGTTFFVELPETTS